MREYERFDEIWFMPRLLERERFMAELKALPMRSAKAKELLVQSCRVGTGYEVGR